MARNKRDNKRSMGGANSTQAMSIEEYMGQTLGDWESIRSPHKYMNAVPISIFDIFPDEQQPRRAIPNAVRERWERTDEPEEDMPRLFEIWEAMVNESRPENAPFNLMNYLGQDVVAERAEEDTTYDPEMNPVELALVKVADIALSVRKYGLNNPITVAPLVPSGYLIETGERRWLAFHLLHAKGLKTQQERIDDDFSAISARKVEAVSVWRQAAENGARADLNAIAKARQIAVLTMDLHSAINNTEFAPFEAFDHERHFYAQIFSDEESSFLRAIRGTQDHIIAAVGLKSGRQVSQYRKLLTLPDRAWELADDHNLSEYSLRGVVDDKTTSETEKIDLVERIVAGETSAGHDALTGTSAGDSDDNGTTVPSARADTKSRAASSSANPSPPPDGPGDLAVPTPQFFSNAAKTFNLISRDNPEANRNAWLYLEKLREYLEKVEERLYDIED